MKNISALPFLWAMASAPIYAAPFVVSDPYPPDTAQPSEFVISVSGTQAPVIIPATATPQGAILRWDVSSVSGSKTITVKARNVRGESAATPPFTFTVGPPAPPSGIGLSDK
jgi:hypothetical protein